MHFLDQSGILNLHDDESKLQPFFIFICNPFIINTWEANNILYWQRHSAFGKPIRKIGLPQTKNYNYETGPQISMQFNRCSSKSTKRIPFAHYHLHLLKSSPDNCFVFRWEVVNQWEGGKGSVSNPYLEPLCEWESAQGDCCHWSCKAYAPPELLPIFLCLLRMPEDSVFHFQWRK